MRVRKNLLYDVGINTKVYSCPVEALKFMAKYPLTRLRSKVVLIPEQLWYADNADELNWISSDDDFDGYHNNAHMLMKYV